MTGSASLFAGERQQLLHSTSIALQPCETRFDSATVKVSGDDVIDEASPEPVPLLESLLPASLDILEVSLHELIKHARARIARAVNGRIAAFGRSDGGSGRRSAHGSCRRNP